MRILISSIACDPSLGSEAKVGWDAVCAISERHECHVLTHVKGKAAIEDAQANGLAPGVRFHYHGIDFKWHSNRLLARLQSWAAFSKWQRTVLPLALRLHGEYKFDLVHQVTYATWRIPSPLWQMPIPFVWGPIGGAARFPWRFVGMLSWQATAFELARATSSFVSLRSPAARKCIRRSAMVLAANAETTALLAPLRGSGPMDRLPVAFFSEAQLERFRPNPTRESNAGQPLHCFAGGNMGGPKGVALALKAIALAVSRGASVHYTIAGGGPEEANLKRLATDLGISRHVTFTPSLRGADYVRRLQDSDVYLLPSFRETTPVTLLEAILSGCFPVVANASAAGEIVSRIGGQAVTIENPHATIDALASALDWCDKNRASMRQKALDAGNQIRTTFCKQEYLRITESAYAKAIKRKAEVGKRKAKT